MDEAYNFHSIFTVVVEELERLKKACDENPDDTESFKKGNQLINSCEWEALDGVPSSYFDFFKCGENL